MAHPDDIEFSCGGSVAKLTDDGWEVSFCLVTSGDKGGKDVRVAPANLAALREAEQGAAAALLGVARCLFLRWPDGFVEESAELRETLVGVIRQERPSLLITWDGYRGFNHRDHRAVGIAALDAAYPLARSPHYFPEQAARGLEPHRVNTVWLAGSREPDYFVDVSRQLDRRIDALRCHVSQVKATTRDELAQRLQRRAADAITKGRVPWAEGFRRLFFGQQSAPRRTALLAARETAT